MDTEEIRQAFVKGLWNIIPNEEETEAILNASQLPHDRGSCGDYNMLVKQMLDVGISADMIARFEKLVGYEVAAGICYYLEDPDLACEFVEEPDDLEWTLFSSKDCEPIDRLAGLHESLMSADPSGREMRPK